MTRAVRHHDEAVAQADGVGHVVRDHEGGELALETISGELEHLGRGLGVEGRRVLVEEQQFAR